MDRIADVVSDEFFASWYHEHGRPFPWRTKEVPPFQLLVTEMLLRQTRAMQVERIWNDFMQQFGTPAAISAADRDQLFAQVEQLGFGTQRVDALNAASTHLLEYHDGHVPTSIDELLKIPHVGPYTAHAVLCFAHERVEAVVDTNILRIFCRLLGREVIRLDIRREPWAWEIARKLLPDKPGKVQAHNYGLLDFTAAICKPRSPQCQKCPLAARCAYGQRVAREQDVTGLP